MRSYSTAMQLVLLLLGTILLAGIGFCDDGRTVIDNTRGGYFTYPYENDWAGLGVTIGMKNERYRYELMNPEAAKGVHGRLQHGGNENNDFYYVRYTALKAYEADEVRQGRDPFFATAYWEGKHRPVVFSWLLDYGVVAEAINIRDDRFIKFFINQFSRKFLMDPYHENWWVGLDNCAFNYDLYGVMDDSAPKYVVVDEGNNGRPGFHPASEVGIVSWDKPFPQNDDEWVKSAAYAFQRIKEWAPDIRIICNEGSLNDQSQFGEVFGNTDGVILEGFMVNSEKWNEWERSTFHSQTRARLSSSVYRDKVQIFQPSHIRPAEDNILKSAYCGYLLLAGPNAFFGPNDPESVEIAPSRYAEIKNSLGKPIGDIQCKHLDAGEANWLYSRQCEGGIVYFNNSDSTQTVALPSGVWYDHSGKRVAELVLSKGTADFVGNINGKRCATPQINPRRSRLNTGSVTINMSVEPWMSGATIRYTTDGSTPGPYSKVYSHPIVVKSSCTISARAFKAGLAGSFVACADYKITRVPPTISFHLAKDSGSEFLDNYPLVKLSNPSSREVRVDYVVTGGSAKKDADHSLSSGTLVFPPGEMYRHFKIPIIDNKTVDGNRSIEISLAKPKNAVIGDEKRFEYTIVDND